MGQVKAQARWGFQPARRLKHQQEAKTSLGMRAWAEHEQSLMVPRPPLRTEGLATSCQEDVICNLRVRAELLRRRGKATCGAPLSASFVRTSHLLLHRWSGDIFKRQRFEVEQRAGLKDQTASLPGVPMNLGSIPPKTKTLGINSSSAIHSMTLSKFLILSLNNLLYEMARWKNYMEIYIKNYRNMLVNANHISGRHTRDQL